MGISRSGNWLAVVRTKFLRSSRRETIIIVHTNDTASNFSQQEEPPATEAEQKETTTFLVPSTQKEDLPLNEEEIAAFKIQSYFRRHLARRAFRALRSLVKLQAVVRGVCVRRQARIAMHCMHALTRLQLTVRARQLLSREM